MHTNTEKIPLLLSLVLSLPRDEAGFHISALEQIVTASQGTQNSPWGGVCSPQRCCQNLRHLWREKGRALQVATGSGRVPPSPQCQSQYFPSLYRRRLQSFCLPPSQECRAKDPFPHPILRTSSVPAGKAILGALSGVGPFCDAGRCAVLCPWGCCTDRSRAPAAPARGVGGGSGSWEGL